MSKQGGYLVSDYIFKQTELPGVGARAWRFAAFRLLSLSAYLERISVWCANKGHGVERHEFAAKIKAYAMTLK